ncbi:gamma-glutamyltransferase family protein [Bradyrhizobium canariense]|uniref:Gamma-glutamyltransferase 2. Threonine peptidase. MEROPS family T03 n=1 Tax=Bradyrhizobium canariense TaxID=255045 RepID=A0A1H1SHZ7_9BRAD|nr:gamma-glutamyltransferase family protein [Bradyrhizobium canariense]SDS47605.1 gamma-glutamyltransferase 2. Threonine peptidase. MEROPS family T03 [Bradyrhizobium canariense]
MFTTRPEIAGSFGVAASTHWIATQVAMAVLERGGNAFDAATAAGFTLQVVEPHLNGPGGDLPAIIHCARTKTQHVICGHAGAPRAATIDVFRKLGIDQVPGTGLLPAVVPGSFDGWCLMLRDWGTWEFADVIAFAIGYARRGAYVLPNINAAIESVRAMFESAWPTSAAVFLLNGNVPPTGGLLTRPALAETWERLIREAVGSNREARIDAVRKAWYRGFVAEAIDRFFRDTDVLDVTGRRHRGLLTGDDLAGWTAHVEPPVSLNYRDHTVLKCGVWSQGPAFLQQLALLKGLGVAALNPLGAEFIHIVTESAKLAFADREAYYGDPNYADVPLTQLLSEEYNNDRRRLIGPLASNELRPGSLPGYQALIDHLPSPDVAVTAGIGEPTVAGAGEPTVARLGAVRGDTCHLDVIDRFGNMVSATPSGGWLQSSPVIPELGFCLGTRGQMFSLTPDHPNSLAPGKRPRTTLSPSFALRDGNAWMAFGTPGGDQQDQWSLIFFLRMVDHRMTIQQAIDAPSFHSEHWPSSFWPRTASPGKLVIEGRYGADVRNELKRKGHTVEQGGDWSEGRLSAARIEPDGQMYAGANPRGMQGYAAGR